MKKIEVPEDMGIKKIKEFYTDLGDVIEEDNDIEIDLSNLESLDLSLIQVILAAVFEQKRRGKKLKIQSQLRAKRKSCLYRACARDSQSNGANSNPIPENHA